MKKFKVIAGLVLTGTIVTGLCALGSHLQGVTMLSILVAMVVSVVFVVIIPALTLACGLVLSALNITKKEGV